MARQLILNVVVREDSAISKLLAAWGDESLLFWGNTLFFLYFSLNIFDGVTRRNIESDGPASLSLYEDLQIFSGYVFPSVLHKDFKVLKEGRACDIYLLLVFYLFMQIFPLFTNRWLPWFTKLCEKLIPVYPVHCGFGPALIYKLLVIHPYVIKIVI